jgi:glycosyltransferase involved in cell wall biosynthesis
MSLDTGKTKVFIPQVGMGLKMGICGGSTRLYEQIREMYHSGKFEITIAFSTGGLHSFQTYFINEPKIIADIHIINIKASLLLKKEPFRLFRGWSYIVSTFHLLRLAGKKDFGPFDIALCPSDFFYHILPLIKMKKKGKIQKLFSISHLRCPKPAERKGNFLINWFMYKQQRWVFKKIGVFSDQIFISAGAEGGEIVKEIASYGYNFNPVRVEMGIDYETVKRIPPDPDKKFTLIHLGMRPNKGIYDLPYIWEKVLQRFPDSTLGMIGDISNDDRKKLDKEFKKRNADRNIEYLGLIFGDQKFAIFKSAKLFITPSHEENWAIAVSEAMACGLPVAGYDLIAYKSVYGDSIAYARSFDTGEFAEKVCALLSSPKEYESYQKKGTATILKYDWKKIFARELEYYKKG